METLTTKPLGKPTQGSGADRQGNHVRPSEPSATKGRQNLPSKSGPVIGHMTRNSHWRGAREASETCKRVPKLRIQNHNQTAHKTRHEGPQTTDF